LQPDCLSVLVEPSYLGSLDQAVEPFAALCERAATGGHRCALEFFAWSPLHTLVDTWRILEGAGAANGGLIFDTWHHYRVGGTADDLDQVDARRIVGVQLSDAPATPTTSDVARECMADRRWPGEGDAEVAGTGARLRQRGCTAPLGIEVFGAGDPFERARHAATALARLTG
jgi:sugar phosphate isomerase/epimerase